MSVNMPITPVYAALVALLFFGLSVRTLRLRRSLNIPIGDAGDQRMLRAMRVHSNCAEYAPFSLLLILSAEMQGAPALLVHFLGLCLLVGRLTHALGVSRERENYSFRVAGMALTFTALITAAGYSLAKGAGLA